MKTKKAILSLLMISVLLLSVGMAIAKKDGQAGKSDVSHLYLYEKDANWDIVPDGAWGKMMFKDDKFVFNGHGLDAGVEYTLIYYPDPWPGTAVQCLNSESVIANNGGNVHIAGDFDFALIPTDKDENKDGAKIWLVLTDDVNCGTKMTAWTPTEYLFENNLI